MTPSATLTAAADRIRELAEHYKLFLRLFATAEQAQEQWVFEATSDHGQENAKRWITALSPAISLHVERWLRESAESLARHEPAWRDQPDVFDEPIVRRTPDEVAALVEHHYGAALGAARAILGSGVVSP